MPEETHEITQDANPQYKAWKQRLKSARSERKKRIDGMQRVHRIITGQASAANAGEMKKLGVDTWATFPKLHSYVLSLIPNIMRFQPEQRLRPADASDPFERGFAANLTQYLKTAQTENRMLRHAQIAVYEAIIGGVGCLISGYDEKVGRTYTRAFHARDLLWDTQGSAIPGSMKWIGREVVFDIAYARQFFAKPDLKGNMSEGDSDAIGVPMVDEDHEIDAVDADPDDQEKSGGGRIKVAVIYQRGGTPYDEDLPLSEIFAPSQANPEKSEQDANQGYDDRDRILYFKADSGDFLGEKPWNFVLDRDEFPITLITPTIDPTNVWAYAAIDPLVRVQEILDLCVSFNVNRAQANAKDIYIVNTQSGISIDSLRSALKSAEDNQIVEADGQVDPKDIIQKLPLGELSSQMRELANLQHEIFNDVSNYNQLKATAGSSETATEAEIGQERLQAGLANYSSAIEEGFRDCARKEAQLAMNFMSGEQMARITGSLVGREIMSGMAVYEFWPEDPTPAAIRAVDVHITPGSADASSNAEKARNIMQLAGRANEALGVMANAGYIAPAPAIYRLAFGPIIEAAKLMELDQLIEDLPAPEVFQPMPQPVAAGPGGQAIPA